LGNIFCKLCVSPAITSSTKEGREKRNQERRGKEGNQKLITIPSKELFRQTFRGREEGGGWGERGARPVSFADENRSRKRKKHGGRREGGRRLARSVESVLPTTGSKKGEERGGRKGGLAVSLSLPSRQRRRHEEKKRRGGRGESVKDLLKFFTAMATGKNMRKKEEGGTS